MLSLQERAQARELDLRAQELLQQHGRMQNEVARIKGGLPVEQLRSGKKFEPENEIWLRHTCMILCVNALYETVDMEIEMCTAAHVVASGCIVVV